MIENIVLYDISRLINRSNAPTPTGIDRLDLRYFEHFRDDPNTELIGVIQFKGYVMMVAPRGVEMLWSLLGHQWLDGQLGAGSKRRDVLRVKRFRLQAKARALALNLMPWLRPGKLRIDRKLSNKLQELRGRLIYVNTSHHGIKDETTFRTIKSGLGATVVFYLHDTIPIDFPEFVLRGNHERHIGRTRVIAQCADLVLTNSLYSKSRFFAFCDERALPKPATEVLHIGAEPGFLHHAAALTQHPAVEEDPYFVVVGTIEPRKNLLLLLEVWKRLIAAGDTTPELRLIGKRGWFTDTNRGYDAKLADVATHVRELGPLSDAELYQQVAGARALLFPSFVEGWGLPMVEALTLGTPVIGAQIDAFTEAGQGMAQLLPPDDVDAWVRAIRQAAAQTPHEVAAERKALSAFQPPLWEQHFEKLDALLDTL